MIVNYGSPTPDDYSDRPAIGSAWTPAKYRATGALPPMPGSRGECIGACGAEDCDREDCRQCESCGQYFDRDMGGGSCETYGPMCDDCPSVSCASDCCYYGPDTTAEGDGWR